MWRSQKCGAEQMRAAHSETRPFQLHIFSEVTGSERSQTTQKSHDIWLPGPPSSCPLRAALSQRCQRALLCCEVDLDVDVGGIKRHVSEPGPDRIDVDACLQQVGGGLMTDGIKTDPPAPSHATWRRSARRVCDGRIV